MQATTQNSVKTLPSFTIGDIDINPGITLAPMAGHTNCAFRTLCREQGECGLVCTELISSNALKYKGSREKTFEMFDWQPDEYPVAVQLFGHEPTQMAEAARIVADNGASIIDINMGCWVPKVAKKGGGAALLRDIDAATRVVEAVTRAVDVPVTVKVRSGFEDGVITAVPFARAAEAVGARAIAVHARFAGEGHGGQANWDVVRQVKEAVKAIPVIGNGDIHTGADAAAMLRQTGCDGIMIGRASLGQPWIFRTIAHYLRFGTMPEPPSRSERAVLALRHAHLTLETTALPQYQAIRELRGQISKYRLDEPGSVRIRNQLVRVETIGQVEAVLTPLTECSNILSVDG